MPANRRGSSGPLVWRPPSPLLCPVRGSGGPLAAVRCGWALLVSAACTGPSSAMSVPGGNSRERQGTAVNAMNSSDGLKAAFEPSDLCRPSVQQGRDQSRTSFSVTEATVKGDRPSELIWGRALRSGLGASI